MPRSRSNLNLESKWTLSKRNINTTRQIQLVHFDSKLKPGMSIRYITWFFIISVKYVPALKNPYSNRYLSCSMINNLQTSGVSGVGGLSKAARVLSLLKWWWPSTDRNFSGYAWKPDVKYFIQFRVGIKLTLCKTMT